MPKEKRKNIRDKMAEALELPRELLKDYSRITVLGKEDVWIENYKSILEYDESFIRISNDICIYGLNLSVEEISDEDILIVGDIQRIEFE